MKFKKGDKVSFLNEIGGGIVNRTDERGYIYVLTDDGFEIPVTEKELVRSGGFSFKENREDMDPIVPEVKSPERQKEKPGITKKLNIPENIASNAKIELRLGFIPDRVGPVFNSSVSCYLINDSPYFLYFMIGSREGGSLYHISSGHVEADTKTFLKSFDQTSLSKISDIHVQLLFVSKGKYHRSGPVDQMIRLNLINFSKESYYRDNDYFDDKAIIFTLNGNHEEKAVQELEVPDEIIELKSNADNPSVKSKKKEPASDTLEVDLHFDQDSMNASQLNPSAILALQMSRFHSAIEEAISKNLRRLVVIHGLGQGILKIQIRKELQEKYPDFIFQEASFKEYGFGATMVHLNFDKKQ